MGRLRCTFLHEDERPSKALTWDDTVLLDGIDLPFVGPLLLQLAQSKSANENLFAFEADDIVKVFAEACHILKLPIDTVL